MRVSPLALLVVPLLVQCSQPKNPWKPKEKPKATEQGGGNQDPKNPQGSNSGNGSDDILDKIGSGQAPACLASDPTPGPAVKANADGAVVRTIGSGRVRLRHEKEALFAKFGSFYWEKRSFEVIVEDYSATADRKLVITFKPLGQHAIDGSVGLDGLPNGGLPNIRIFDSGDGNVFRINEQMKDQPQSNVFTYTFKDPGNNKDLALTPGRVIEFEFGIFLEKKVINTKTEGDTNYYADTFRLELGKPGFLAGKAGVVGGKLDELALAGGATTIPPLFVAAEMNLSYSQNALNAQAKSLQTFLEGRSLFHTNFTTGNHSENNLTFKQDQIDRQKGLAGPVMDTTACSECHSHNGRLQADTKTAPQHVLKLGVKGAGDSIQAHSEFGIQLQQSERTALGSKLSTEVNSNKVTLGDGTVVNLQSTRYKLEGEGNMLSARIPTQTIGLGLLEAISDESILSRASCKPDEAGISGKAVIVTDPETKKSRLGRFGWKAGKVSLKHQVGEALLVDLGVTNPLFPSAACEKTGSCQPANSTEVDAQAVDRITGYMQMVAVPAQRDRENPAFARGEKVFAQLGCPACHVPKQVTGQTHPLTELRGQTIYPFTDLLVHDMGDGLADPKPEGQAAGREWRTPPLWGLGLMKTVNGQMLLLHDGRAKSHEEAILWHGGEAANAQAGYKALKKTDRDDLQFFLNSI